MDTNLLSVNQLEGETASPSYFEGLKACQGFKISSKPIHAMCKTQTAIIHKDALCQQQYGLRSAMASWGHAFEWEMCQINATCGVCILISLSLILHKGS